MMNRDRLTIYLLFITKGLKMQKYTYKISDYNPLRNHLINSD